MARKNKQHSKQFKLNAVHYVKAHPDLTQVECAKNLGISITTLSRWLSQYRDNEGDIPVLCFRNAESSRRLIFGL